MNTLSDLFKKISERIDGKTFEVLGIKVFTAVVILLAAFWLARIVRRSLDRHLGNGDQGAAAARIYKSVARLVILVPGILLAVHTLGFDLSALFSNSGLFALAAAFALKNIAENYTSGAMLRVERSISPGDVLETEGVMVRVRTIGFRATIVRAKDEKDMVIPNSQLVQQRVSNYTLRDSVCRVWTFVGVAYSSDLKQVREILERTCDQLEGKSDQHAPEVLLTEFGSSSVNYKVSVWIEDPWLSGLVKSDLNEAIWWALQEANIVIAYPQLDVHFDQVEIKAPAGQGSAVPTDQGKADRVLPQGKAR